MLLLIENTRGVNVPWFICLPWFFHFKLFFFLFIHNMALLQGRVAITTGAGVENSKKLKNVCCLVPRNLESWHLPLPRLNCLTFYLNISPDNGVSLGSISVSLHTSDITFAVRSRISLCRIYIKPPFLQLILCWISNLLPQGQDVGRLLFSQPYRSLIESQNCCLDNSNQNSVIESNVNQFENPVRVDISARRFSL